MENENMNKNGQRILATRNRSNFMSTVCAAALLFVAEVAPSVQKLMIKEDT
jgi:hypothetical protein